MRNIVEWIRDAAGVLVCLVLTRGRHAWHFRRAVFEVIYPDDWQAGDPRPAGRQFVAENCKHCGVEQEVHRV